MTRSNLTILSMVATLATLATLAFIFWIFFIESGKSRNNGLFQRRLSPLINVFSDGQLEPIHSIHQGTQLARLNVF